MSQNTVSMRLPTIKNKAANPVQITAEQLLKDAQDHKEQTVIKTDVGIRDEEELESIKYERRKYFEKKTNLQKSYIGLWIKYAVWEESVQEFKRARSVYERALEIDYKNVGLWLKYVEMEMRHKFINHARNVFERAIDILPRVEQFWYKYAYMEEILGNYLKARAIFRRWMEWTPPEKAWMAFLSFEQRMKEPENCKEVLYGFMEAHPNINTYIKVAKYEQKQRNFKAARDIYEKTIEDLGQEALQEKYFIAFSTFEIKNKEFDRAREIFRFGLENIPKEKCQKLYSEYIGFEKQFGKKEEIDGLIFNQRRQHYKELIDQNSMNYDAWFDLVNLEISTKHHNRTVETFEAAVKNTPPIQEKRFWRRYIYLWYSYASYLEIEQGDMEKACEVYERVLQIIPHKQFSFSKLWINYAHLQIRCENVDKARKILGTSIGKCPTEKIFDAYIELENQLADLERVRTLYQRYAEVFPDNPTPWIKWAEKERSLDEMERYRQIFEIAIDNTQLSMPETVWRAYIDNETDEKAYDNVRKLYERLLERTKHIKIWITYAQFEQQMDEKDKCREVLKRGETFMKDNDLKEERATLLDNWRQVEIKFGDADKIQEILKKQPKKIKKKRKIQPQEGEEYDEENAGLEEFYEYTFPDDEGSKGILKMLERAKKYKEQKAKELN